MRARAESMRLAAVLACMAAMACAAADAPPLGRLFHTPEERARLDRMRRGETHEAATAAAATSPGEVTGFVKRSDGRNTVWIDGQPLPARTPGASQLLDPRGVRAYADRRQDDLKVERRPPR